MLNFFIFSAVLSLVFTPLVKLASIRLGLIDKPNLTRKVHSAPTPLFGGFAVFLSFFVTVAVGLWLGGFDLSLMPIRFLIGIFLGALVLMIGGFLDDKYALPAKVMWIFPGLAALVVVGFGIGTGITFINNPFGGQINISYKWIGIPLAGVFTWIWLMVSAYTTKILDGLDGLVSSVGVVSALILFVLSLRPEIGQTSTAILALTLAGSLLGFLPYAWHPAKIFIGEGGSTFVGFILGVLAVIAGAKVATAVIVMGLPMMDVVWAILRRTWRGQNPFKGDREHLHHLFLNAGLSHPGAVACYLAVSAGFGLAAVFLQTKAKFWAILMLVALMAILVPTLRYLARRRAVLLDKTPIK